MSIGIHLGGYATTPAHAALATDPLPNPTRQARCPTQPDRPAAQPNPTGNHRPAAQPNPTGRHRPAAQRYPFRPAPTDDGRKSAYGVLWLLGEAGGEGQPSRDSAIQSISGRARIPSFFLQ